MELQTALILVQADARVHPTQRYAFQLTFFCLLCLTFSIALSYAFPPSFLEQHTKYPQTDYSRPTSTSSARARPHSPRDRPTDRPARIRAREITALLRLHLTFGIMIPGFLDTRVPPHSPKQSWAEETTETLSTAFTQGHLYHVALPWLR